MGGGGGLPQPRDPGVPPQVPRSWASGRLLEAPPPEGGLGDEPPGPARGGPAHHLDGACRPAPASRHVCPRVVPQRCGRSSSRGVSAAPGAGCRLGVLWRDPGAQGPGVTGWPGLGRWVLLPTSDAHGWAPAAWGEAGRGLRPSVPGSLQPPAGSSPGAAPTPAWAPWGETGSRCRRGDQEPLGLGVLRGAAGRAG